MKLSRKLSPVLRICQSHKNLFKLDWVIRLKKLWKHVGSFELAAQGLGRFHLLWKCSILSQGQPDTIDAVPSAGLPLCLGVAGEFWPWPALPFLILILILSSTLQKPEMGPRSNMPLGAGGTQGTSGQFKTRSRGTQNTKRLKNM